MAKNTSEPEVDEDGLVVQKYVSMVLVVIPNGDFGEQALRHARSSLYNVHVGTRSVSDQVDELIKGRLQDEFMVDEHIDQASMADYSGVIFAGGDGALELAKNPKALELAQNADRDQKMIGTWGQGIAILAAAGILKGRKVTGPPSLADTVRKAGGRYSSRQLMTDKNLVTCLDEAVGLRFGKALVQVVAVQ